MPWAGRRRSLQTAGGRSLTYWKRLNSGAGARIQEGRHVTLDPLGRRRARRCLRTAASRTGRRPLCARARSEGRQALSSLVKPFNLKKIFPDPGIGCPGKKCKTEKSDLKHRLQPANATLLAQATTASGVMKLPHRGQIGRLSKRAGPSLTKARKSRRKTKRKIGGAKPELSELTDLKIFKRFKSEVAGRG